MRVYATLPPRRWCREVLALRHAASDLLDHGTALTDPRVLSLSRRLDRLMLSHFETPSRGTALTRRPPGPPQPALP